MIIKVTYMQPYVTNDKVKAVQLNTSDWWSAVNDIVDRGIDLNTVIKIELNFDVPVSN